jgi:zinc transport system substrate-binding protein
MRPLLRLAAASLAALVALAGARSTSAAEPPHPRPLRVVATIKPLHSLIAGVMSGHGAPTLLIPAGVSPSAAEIHANEAYLLSGADLVFWVGSPLEASLQDPLTRFAASARVVELARVSALVRYKSRTGGYWEPSGEPVPDTAGAADPNQWLGWYGTGGDDAPDSSSSDVDPPLDAAAGEDPTEDPAEDAGEDPELAAEAAVDLTGVDGHVWLDPLNAQLIVDRIVEVLSEADIDNAPDYRRNGESVKSRLKLLDTDMETMLAPARGRPFLVLHDAYQYLEVRYALAGSGSLKVPPDQPPAADRLEEIHAKIEARQARCVFGDPRVPSRLTESIVEGTGARVGELDPVGVGIPDGIDLYFMMMRRLATSLKDCLAG